jgi:hypothetical protein
LPREQLNAALLHHCRQGAEFSINPLLGLILGESHIGLIMKIQDLKKLAGTDSELIVGGGTGTGEFVQAFQEF